MLRWARAAVTGSIGGSWPALFADAAGLHCASLTNCGCRDTDALAVQHAAAAGWGLLDAFAITRPLLDMPEPPLWDGRHFLGGWAGGRAGGWVGGWVTCPAQCRVGVTVDIC